MGQQRGFPATVVYHILERLLEMAESPVRGDTTDIVEAREQVAKARLNQEQIVKSAAGPDGLVLGWVLRS